MFQKQKRKIIIKDNLTKEERTVLKELADQNNIVIRKADKEGTVVITDVDDYIKETPTRNKNAYKKLFSMAQHKHIQDYSMTQ